MRTLARRVENGTARVVAATVRRESGGWLVSFTVVAQRPDPVAASTPANGGKVIGLDLGLTTLVTGASPHGEVLLEAGNPRNYRKAERRLASTGVRRHRRRGPRHRKHGEEPVAGETHSRCRVGRAGPPAGVQGRLVRRDGREGLQVLPEFQDVLRLQGSESQAVPDWEARTAGTRSVAGRGGSGKTKPRPAHAGLGAARACEPSTVTHV